MEATVLTIRTVVVGREITKRGLRLLVVELVLVELEVWSNRGYVLLIISKKVVLISTKNPHFDCVNYDFNYLKRLIN